jgi:RNA polymerase sigma factor (sigma-70 family)
MTHRDDPEKSDKGAQARLSMSSQEDFFLRYWPHLVRTLKSQASNSSLAEDVAVETFMAAFDKWDALLTYSRPDSWLYKVAIRKLRRLEEKARGRASLAEDPVSSEADLRRASLEDEWVELNLDLMRALRLLPIRQAEVFTLRCLEDCTVKETAEILGVTEDTVKKQQSRAKAKLRVLLRSHTDQPD